MKKQILILLVFPLLFSCGDGRKMDNGLTQNNLNGKVKEIICTEYTVKESFGEVKKDGVKYKREQKFNKQGNITESNIYDKDGKLTYKHTYKYDKDGNTTESNTYDKNGDLSNKEQYKYQYDKKKNWIVFNGAYLTNINLTDNTDEDYKITRITEREITYY